MERLILKAIRISLEFIFVRKLLLRNILLRWMVSGFVQWTVHSERSRNSSDGHVRSYIRLQDKHLSPKHLIKLSSIQRKQTKRKTRIHQPQLTNGEPLFRQIFMLPSPVVLENKPLKKTHPEQQYAVSGGWGCNIYTLKKLYGCWWFHLTQKDCSHACVMSGL